MMRYLINTILLFLISINMHYASEKKVLVEILTNSHCPVCPPAHFTLNNYLQTPNANNIVYIYYHMSFPYSSDELYKHNIEDSDAKNNFYGPHSSTPKAFFDGKLVGNSYNSWATSLDELATQNSPFEIELSGNFTTDNFIINASVTQTANVAATDFTINYVVVENVNYSGNNGINNHSNVMRKIVNPQGDLFDISLNETKKLETSIDFNNSWGKSKTKIIVFIQSKSQKTVYQSASINYSDLIITDVENENNIVIDFKLFQNYPNPFNPTTTIKYIIPNIVNTNQNFSEQKINLVVYDILGNNIITLINEVQNSGNHEVQFNATSLSSGIYYYQLSIGNFIETKKMILLK